MDSSMPPQPRIHPRRRGAEQRHWQAPPSSSSSHRRQQDDWSTQTQRSRQSPAGRSPLLDRAASQFESIRTRVQESYLPAWQNATNNFLDKLACGGCVSGYQANQVYDDDARDTSYVLPPEDGLFEDPNVASVRRLNIPQKRHNINDDIYHHHPDSDPTIFMVKTPSTAATTVACNTSKSRKPLVLDGNVHKPQQYYHFREETSKSTQYYQDQGIMSCDSNRTQTTVPSSWVSLPNTMDDSSMPSFDDAEDEPELVLELRQQKYRNQPGSIRRVQSESLSKLPHLSKTRGFVI